MIKYIPRYKSIKPKRLHDLIPDWHDKTPFIYFLLKRGRVVYIGQSHALRKRVHSHNTHGEFWDRIRFMECKDESLKSYERRWIELFQPKYNIMYTKANGRNKTNYISVPE